ncbi:MAG: DUF1801 domain-containing protein [Gemmatimonadales bacterium]
MAELKTRPTSASVAAFVARIADPGIRKACRDVGAMMRRATGNAPVMWGPSIVGYGNYQYRYASGRSGEWFLAGFSPRKRELTIYLMGGLKRHARELERLGPHRVGGGCLYLKSLDAIDRRTLGELIALSVADLRAQVARQVREAAQRAKAKKVAAERQAKAKKAAARQKAKAARKAGSGAKPRTARRAKPGARARTPVKKAARRRAAPGRQR